MPPSDNKKSVWKGKFSGSESKPKHKPKTKKKPTKTEGGEGTADKKKRPRGGRKHRSEQRKRQKSEAGNAHEEGTSGDGLSDGSDGEAAPPPKQPPSEARLRKVAKLKNRLKQKKSSAAEFEAARALAATIACRAPAEQASWLFASAARCLPLTDLERESSGLTASCMAPLPSGAPLEAGLQALEPGWRRELAAAAGRAPGQPSALVVSPAAMGAVSAIKACPQLNAGCKMAKLFAKHFKVEEQAAALAEAPAAAAAGTPHRLARLFEAGALGGARLRWVVLDVRVDAKGRTIADSPEAVGDWWALWARWLAPLVAGGQAKVVLWGGDA